MIIVSKPSKPFTYTAKNTARRQAVIKDYEPEIEELYSQVEETTQPGLLLPSNWGPTQSLEFVRAAVFTVLKRELGDYDDIFQNGCDRCDIFSSTTWPTGLFVLTASLACKQLGFATRYWQDCERRLTWTRETSQ